VAIQLEQRVELGDGEQLGFDAGRPVSLVGITREADMPMDECYLGYLWVDPQFRRQGTASGLIKDVLGRLKKSGVRTVFLWVLDGNDSAMRNSLSRVSGTARTRPARTISRATSRPPRSPARQFGPGERGRPVLFHFLYLTPVPATRLINAGVHRKVSYQTPEVFVIPDSVSS
jgi:hypothetical protein